VIVQIATLGHLAKKSFEQKRIAANGIEVRGRALFRGLREQRRSEKDTKKTAVCLRSPHRAQNSIQSWREQSCAY
jgi:hypothetical protein